MMITTGEQAIAMAYARCGSPIEESFLSCLVPRLAWVVGELHPRDAVAVLELKPGFDVAVGQQVPLLGYRLDFSMYSADDRFLAIELDGHEFHERTREQAARDRARDRKLQLRGVSVFRFTGSEVWKDASACVEQCLEFFRRKEAV